ncbi:MAG: threonine aldolase [Pseudomonadota bacterium]
MPIHPQEPLRQVINAWGTATPYGVSRSASEVARAVAQVLDRFVSMQELQAHCALRIVRWSGAEAACVTHCTAAALTLAVAACMAGGDARRIAQLPDAAGMPARVPLLAGHQVNYGQAITQAVRLAGAQPVPCDGLDAVRGALAAGGVACVLAVESHLAPGSGAAVTAELAALARAAGVPLVLDAAAQDRRVRELVAGGADLVLLSAQKYLAGPTAGLVLGGDAALVAAVDAQHTGIGRGMKPTKEALAGVMAALALREAEDTDAWRDAQQAKVREVMESATRWRGIAAHAEADPQGNGFARIWLAVDPARAGLDAAQLAARLREGDPIVAVAPHRLAQGQVGLELTGVAAAEVPPLCAAIAAALPTIADDAGNA